MKLLVIALLLPTFAATAQTPDQINRIKISEDYVNAIV